MYYTLPVILNFDKAYEETQDTVLINDHLHLPKVDDVIAVLCDETVTSDIASCPCGETVGNYFKTCKICNGPVEEKVLSDICNDTWIDVPEAVGPVLHPVLFSIINYWLKNDSNGVPILASILDQSIKVAPEFESVITGQGFKWFYKNFGFIIDYFSRVFERTRVKEQGKWVPILLDQYSDRIWCTKLPFLSKGLQTITVTGSTKLVDKSVNKIMLSVFNMADALLMDKVLSANPTKAKFIEQKFYSVYSDYCEYHYKDMVKDKLNPKRGHLRKHLYGSRFNLSFRGVITPISGYHRGDDLHLPWQMGVGVFLYHILAILINRYNYSVSDGYIKLQNAYVRYDFMIDQIMQEICQSTKYRGFPCLFNRNPSLKLEAVQLMFITKVKPALQEDPFKHVDIRTIETDTSYQFSDQNTFLNRRVANENVIIESGKKMEVVNAEEKDGKTYIDVASEDLVVREKLNHLINDKSIAISPLVITGPNADFDGDEMNGVIIPEMAEVEEFMNLHPIEQVLSTDDIKMGNTLKLSNQLCVMLTNWVNHKRGAL